MLRFRKVFFSKAALIRSDIEIRLMRSACRKPSFEKMGATRHTPLIKVREPSCPPLFPRLRFRIVLLREAVSDYPKRSGCLRRCFRVSDIRPSAGNRHMYQIAFPERSYVQDTVCRKTASLLRLCGSRCNLSFQVLS